MRRAPSLATGLLICGLAACSSNETPESIPGVGTTNFDSQTSASAPATTAATTPTTTSQAPALPPLSPFENDEKVKVLRTFAATYGRAVNAKAATYAPWIATLSSAGRAIAPEFITDDIKLGGTYPGPLPFTPLEVYPYEGKQRVNACVWSHGWQVDRATGAVQEKKAIEPTYFQLSQVDGAWKVDTAGPQDGLSCTPVRVEGRPW